jgi:hypothetical protein
MDAYDLKALILPARGRFPACARSTAPSSRPQATGPRHTGGVRALRAR